MAIKGLTDTTAKSDRRMLGRIEVKVFKGARKNNNSAGKCLADKFRIVTTNQRAIRILKETYGKSDENGDFLTDFINVYFPFDEPERTFNTTMKKYSASKLEIVCDREFISMESDTETDSNGNVHNIQKDCRKPCPVSGKQFSEKCPNGCSQQGEFYFYIRELFDADMMVASNLTTHAFEDLTYISDRLDMLRDELGSITNTPFPCFQTRHKIPFTLTKTKVEGKRPVMSNGKRTGKNASKENWMICINPDESWMEIRRAWELAEQMKQMNLQLPAKTAMHLLRGDVENLQTANLIEEAMPVTHQELGLPHKVLAEGPQSSATRGLIPAATVTEAVEYISREKWSEIQQRFIHQGWNNNAIQKAICGTFSIVRMGEIEVDWIPQIESWIEDPVQKEFWSISWDSVADSFLENAWEEEALNLMLQEEFRVSHHNSDDAYNLSPTDLHTLKTKVFDAGEIKKWTDKAAAEFF